MTNTALSSVLSQRHLHIRIWREDDGYIAKCLDIPGCVSQGDSKAEALANVNEAIRMCLDVIREDAGSETPSNEAEIIESPIEQFLGDRA